MPGTTTACRHEVHECVVVTVIEAIGGCQIVRGFFSEIAVRHRRDILRFVFRERIRKSSLAPP